MNAAFSEITETPGIGATREQLAMLATRYNLAARYARSGAILEVACGTGIGLGFLADAGGAVTGNDIDLNNVQIARKTWSGDSRIRVEISDAANLAYGDGSFISVVCFEALYYFPDLSRCLNEMVRVLMPGGTLVLCSVNPAWSGFNRSPYTVDYPNPATLTQIVQNLGCEVVVYGGFPDVPCGLAGHIVRAVRRLAVKLHLIPGSMRGKELLKKIFLGGTVPMPSKLTQATAPVEPLTVLPNNTIRGPWKVFYLTATKII